jgi:hypothetical protein
VALCGCERDIVARVRLAEERSEGDGGVEDEEGAEEVERVRGVGVAGVEESVREAA